jgi:hypothetical protein
MRYTVYCIIVCLRTKIRMISSLRDLCVRILDADRFTIVVFQILDIKSNYLLGIVHTMLFPKPLFLWPVPNLNTQCIDGLVGTPNPLQNTEFVLSEPKLILHVLPYQQRHLFSSDRAFAKLKGVHIGDRPSRYSMDGLWKSKHTHLSFAHFSCRVM